MDLIKKGTKIVEMSKRFTAIEIRMLIELTYLVFSPTNWILLQDEYLIAKLCMLPPEDFQCIYSCVAKLYENIRLPRPDLSAILDKTVIEDSTPKTPRKRSYVGMPRDTNGQPPRSKRAL
jgi:hypothetical protein